MLARSMKLALALALASSVAASLLLPGHERRQHAVLPRRSLFGLGTAAAMAAAFPSGSVQPVAAAGNPLPLPPAAVVLEIADNTLAMQGMMIQSVKDMDDLTEQQRKDVGRYELLASSYVARSTPPAAISSPTTAHRTAMRGCRAATLRRTRCAYTATVLAWQHHTRRAHRHETHRTHAPLHAP